MTQVFNSSSRLLVCSFSICCTNNNKQILNQSVQNNNTPPFTSAQSHVLHLWPNHCMTETKQASKVAEPTDNFQTSVFYKILQCAALFHLSSYCCWEHEDFPVVGHLPCLSGVSSFQALVKVYIGFQQRHCISCIFRTLTST